MPLDYDQIRREGMRWLILETLNNARPIAAYEDLIITVARAVYPDVTPLELRRALDYLATRELIVLEKSANGRWSASLSRTGIDVAEYAVAVEPGIARPEKYWGGA